MEDKNMEKLLGREILESQEMNLEKELEAANSKLNELQQRRETAIQQNDEATVRFCDSRIAELEASNATAQSDIASSRSEHVSFGSSEEERRYTNYAKSSAARGDTAAAKQWIKKAVEAHVEEDIKKKTT